MYSCSYIYSPTNVLLDSYFHQKNTYFQFPKMPSGIVFEINWNFKQFAICTLYLYIRCTFWDIFNILKRFHDLWLYVRGLGFLLDKNSRLIVCQAIHKFHRIFLKKLMKLALKNYANTHFLTLITKEACNIFLTKNTTLKIRHFCLVKCSRETIHSLQYFWNILFTF